MSDTGLDKFQKLYLDKDYFQAMKWLESNKNQFDAGVYNYNLGTVYFKQEKYAEARYHFEQASELGMYTPALLKNLNASRTKLGVKSFESSESFLDYWYQAGSSISIEAVWSFAMIIVLIAIGFKHFKQTSKKLLLSLVLIGFLPLVLKYFYFSSFSYVVSLSPQAVYEGPSKIFAQSNSLPVGSKLLIESSKENWAKVISPIKASGWIEKKDFQSLTITP